MAGDVKIYSFRNTDFFSCNVIVISSPKGVLVIDPGYYDKEGRNYIRTLGQVDAILLTHGHWDHIFGLQAICADFPDTPVYLFRGQTAFLTDTVLNCSEPQKFDVIVDVDTTELDEGIAEIAGYTIEVIHTPGHVEGCCMYYFPDEGFLVAGDTVLETMFGTTFRPTGSAERLKQTAQMLLDRDFPESMPCYPGHGNSTDFAHLKKVLQTKEEIT